MGGDVTMVRSRPTSSYRVVTTPVRDDLDVFEARRSARGVAAAAGFSRRVGEELVLAVSELATNIVKFAPEGEIRIERIDDDEHGPGVRITARDSGLPFADFDAVLARSIIVGAPMEWTGRGLGGGLGAVFRFTDILRCEECPGGKQIVAERYLRWPRRPSTVG